MNIKAVISTEKFSILFIGIWLIINAAIFGGTFSYYSNAVEYEYLRQLLGTGFAWARASATCINFNCVLVILPVCRNLLLSLSIFCKCGYSIHNQLWKNLKYHKLFASAILLFSSIHIFAHCFNYAFFYEGNFSGVSLISILTHLPSNSSHLNPVQDTSHGLVYQFLKTVPGITGFLLIVILFLIVSSSTATIRRSHYEKFWYSHHLFILFYSVLIFHGSDGIITKQINLNENDPEDCMSKPTEWGLNKSCKLPIFYKLSSQTWKWILFPFILYLVERIIRFMRSWQTVTVVKIINHPSSVSELQLHKTNFSFRTGQYIYVQCPSISFFEWHPFTITSAPEEPYFSIHVRKAGDWTEEFIRKFSIRPPETVILQLPRIAVDGPYGTPSERVFNYEIVMLVGAGIGVTPFASVLKSFKLNPNKINVEKIHFFWLCPNPYSFEWFAELLQTLEIQMRSSEYADTVSYHIYLTRGWSRNLAWNIFIHENRSTDLITGLRQKTNYGRPNWDDIFAKMRNKYMGKTIGVFCCGPKSLSNCLSEKCQIYSGAEEEVIQFEFHKENF